MSQLTVPLQHAAMTLTSVSLLLGGVWVLASSWVLAQALSPSQFWVHVLIVLLCGLATALTFNQILRHTLKTIQQTLSNLEEQVKQLYIFLENHPAPVWIYDHSGRILEANDAAVHHYGQPKTALLTMRMADLHLPCEPDAEEADASSFWQGYGCKVEVISGELSFNGKPAYWLMAKNLLEHQPKDNLVLQQRQVLQATFDHIPVMITLFDEGGRLQLVNREVETVLGISTEDALARDVLADFYPEPACRQKVLDAMHQADGSWHDFKTRIHDDVLLDTTWCHIRLADGSCIGIGQDVSARKQSEAALKAERDLLDGIMSTSVMAITVLNPRGEILFANPQAETILGLSLSDLVKRTYNSPEWECTDLNGGEWSHAAQPFSRVMQTGEPVYDVRHAIAWPQGHRRFLSVNGAPIKNTQGEITSLVFSISDITSQILAEQEVRQLNEALEHQNRDLEALVTQRTSELFTFINALSDDIFVIEPETMRILFCNTSFAQSMGAERATDLENTTIYEYFEEELASYFAKQNQWVFGSGETLHVQEQLALPGGTRHLDTYKIPLKRPNGDVYALIGSSRDITELMSARQALIERTHQLEIINYELDSFSYSVSHDLRAPLRHIGGFVGALKEELNKTGAVQDSATLHSNELPLQMQSKTGHYLEVIESSSKKMGLLIDGLLMLSRIGRRPMERSRVNLQPLVKRAITLIPPNPSNPVEFQVEPLPTVMGDAALLQQVFTNLIENAVKFSRDRHPAQIHIGALTDGTIFIRDNGVGFQMDYAPQLFGAFQRLHSQHEFEGTGIGLAIVQRIIHRHGGTIWAESLPTQGATFYFTLDSDAAKV